MTCLKKIQNTEVFGSKFSSRTLTTAGDISEFSFKAVVKNIIQGKILEIPGEKNAGTINFDFSQLQTLKKSTYIIEYWGDFGTLGNEPFLLEELSIVSAENATNCVNSDNLNFEIKVEEISIPVTITKAINNFSLNIENLTPEQIALLKGDKGEKGDKGDAGQQGIQGIQGIQGEKGEKGDTGEKGEKGDKGDTGATGLQGIQGIQGVKGDKGEKGEKGDAFTYADFTPTQISELQKPATDKVVELNELETALINSENTRISNENSRVSAENARVIAELERQKNKPVNIKVTTPTSYVTNTVSETEVYRLPLPPGTFNPVDVLKIPLMLIKKLGTNGTVQVRGKMSTSLTMPSGTTDLIFQTPVATAGNQTLGIIKTFFIDGGNIKGTAFTNVSYTDNGGQAGVISEKPFDIDAMNYLYISVINSSSSDQTRLEAFQFTNS